MRSLPYEVVDVFTALKQDAQAMMAIENGCFATVSIPDPALGPRRVDIETMYNTERYRPIYANKEGMPIFLAHAN